MLAMVEAEGVADLVGESAEDAREVVLLTGL